MKKNIIQNNPISTYVCVHELTVHDCEAVVTTKVAVAVVSKTCFSHNQIYCQLQVI